VVTSQKLTGLAVFLAGNKRADLSAEWRSHLSGESGAGLPSRRQPREAAGFVVAAVRYRVNDLAEAAWKPVDTVLESRELSNLVVVLMTLVISVYFLRRRGVYGVADHLEDIAVVSGSTYAAIHALRKYRDVKPPKRKPRRGRP
jgi:hypothetical protein